MDKLVSKNPILRFKLGKKIIKAYQGQQIFYLTDDNGVTNEYWRGGSDWYFRPKGGTGMTRVDYSNKRFYSSTPRGAIANDFNTARNYQHTDYSWMTKGTRQRTPEEILKSKLLSNRAPLQDKELETPKSKVISGPSFYGTRVGGLVKIRDEGFTGFGNLINDKLKQKLIRAGFLDSDFTNVTAFQKALNRYFAGDNAGSILEDGKWGNQTLKAFNLALSKANSPIVTTTKGIEILPASIVPTYTSPTIPSTIPNLNLNTPTYVSANRSQTRDWMRSNNINPYSVTGDMRAAIRRIRAGQANDNDKLLVKNNEQLYNLLKGYYKQGGQLLSKNSVERFKIELTKINFRVSK